MAGMPWNPNHGNWLMNPLSLLMALLFNRTTSCSRNSDNSSPLLAQAVVYRGTVTAADHHGNGQADVLANHCTAAHGSLDPNATWTSWADFANKVHHFWRLVGPQLWMRPDSEPVPGYQPKLQRKILRK
eukprot:283912-Amphidinium_carterae.1